MDTGSCGRDGTNAIVGNTYLQFCTLEERAVSDWSVLRFRPLLLFTAIVTPLQEAKSDTGPKLLQGRR